MSRLTMSLFILAALVGCGDADPHSAAPAPDPRLALDRGGPLAGRQKGYVRTPDAIPLKAYAWRRADNAPPEAPDVSTPEVLDAVWAADIAAARQTIRDRFPPADDGPQYKPPSLAESLFGLGGTVELPPYEFPPAEECSDPPRTSDLLAYSVELIEAEFAKDPENGSDDARAIRDLLVERTVKGIAEGELPTELVRRYVVGTGRLAPLASTVLRVDILPPDRVRQLIYDADAAMAAAGFPAVLRFRSTRLLASQLRSHSPADGAAYADVFADAMKELESSDHPMAGGFRIVMTETAKNQLAKMPWEARWTALGRLTDRTAADELNAYPALYLLGRAHRDYGWEVRGSGFANTVKPEAWPVFEEQMDLASGYYQAAFLRDEKGAEAIEELLYASNATDVGATPRQWLMAGIRAKRYALGTVNAYAFTLTPKWGGSEAMMSDLADALIREDDFGERGLSWAAARVLDRIYDEAADMDEIRAWEGLTPAMGRLAEAVAALDLKAVGDKSWVMRKLLPRLSRLQMYPELLALYRKGAADLAGEGWPEVAEDALETADLLGDEAYVRAMTVSSLNEGGLTPEESAAIRETVEPLAARAMEQGGVRLDLLEDFLAVANVERSLRAGEWADIAVARPSDLVNFYAEEWEASEDGTTVTLRNREAGPRLELFPPIPGWYEVEADVASRPHPDGSVESPFGVVVGLHAVGAMAWTQASPASVGFQELPFERARPHAGPRPAGEFVRLGLRNGEDVRITINGAEAGPFKVKARHATPITVGGLAYWPGPQEVAIRNVRLRLIREAEPIPEGGPTDETSEDSEATEE